MKKSNVFVGRELYSCGACSVESILSYYGGYVPHETVLEDTYTTKTGTNAYNIIKALERYGFSAYGMRLSLDKIDKRKLPAIAHTTIDNYDHFLVIYEITDKKVITMDPRWGAKTYSYEYFEKIYNNVVIIISPLQKIVSMEKKHTLKNIMFKYLIDNRKKILILLNISLLIILLGFILSMFIRIANLNNLYLCTSIFILIIIIKCLLNYFKSLSEEKLSNNFKKDFTYKILSYIFNLDIRYLTNKRVGEIICKINDSSYIIDFFTKSLFSGTIDLLGLILGLILLFIISYKMTLINLASSLLYVFIAVITSGKLYRKEIEHIESYNAYSGDITEYFDGIESIKNLNNEDMYINKLNNSYNRYITSSYKSFKYNLTTSTLKEMILEIGYIISLALAILTLSITNDFYQIIIYTTIYSIYISSLTNIISYIPGFMHIKAIHKSVSEFLDIKSEATGNVSKKTFESIKIDNLKYSYNHINPILNINNIIIKNSDKILLIGSSGKGKSTLVKCLSGYLKDYTGKITIDGVDIKDISMPDLKQMVLYVGQDEKLFTDTILNNIVTDEYDEKKFKDIIDICELNDIINTKENKESALILESGINYSKGEKARIILARSLYKESKILIIDELLSSIPESQENRILNRLLRMENLTLIYITHRNKKGYFNKIINLERLEKNEIEK